MKVAADEIKTGDDKVNQTAPAGSAACNTVDGKDLVAAPQIGDVVMHGTKSSDEKVDESVVAGTATYNKQDAKGTKTNSRDSGSQKRKFLGVQKRKQTKKKAAFFYI